jgi:hypothetical protein
MIWSADWHLASKNAYVPQVSVYVAVITAAAAVIGAAVSQVPILIRDVRQARQDRRERHSDARRQACLNLLGAAGELQAKVENAGQYHGEDMRDKLAEIRDCAAAVKQNAAAIELLAPRPFAALAASLAREAVVFAQQAVANTDLKLNQMVDLPNSGELEQAAEAFRERAVAEASK